MFGGFKARVPQESLVFSSAFAAYSTSAWMLTNKLFPVTAEISPYIKDMGTTMQALLFLLIAFIALHRPRFFVRGMFTAVPLACIAVGTCVLLAGLRNASVATATAGLSLSFAGHVAAIILLGCVSVRLSNDSLGACVLAGLLASYALRVPLSFVPGDFALALYAATEAVAVVLLWSASAHSLDAARMDDAPMSIAVTNPFSFLPLYHPAFICMLIFRMAYGYALTFGEIDYAPLLSVAGAVPTALFVAFLVVRGRLVRTDVTFSIAVLFVVAGLLFVPAAETLGYSLAGNMLEAGDSCFTLLFWLALSSFARKNPRGMLVLFAWSGFLMCVGVLAGALMGRVSNHMLAESAGVATVLTCLITLGFIAYTLVFLRYEGFSFSATAEKLESSPRIEADVQKDGAFVAQDLIEGLAKEHGLTPRETEVFSLLARGRNGRVIQDELVISYNTVKTHVGHIYDKFGIHNHQELLAYIDERRVSQGALPSDV